jgi:hypothetical protein
MEIRLASELPRSGMPTRWPVQILLIVALTTIPALASAVTIDEVEGGRLRVEPILVVVGHGPDRPNAGPHYPGAAPPPQVVVVPSPYAIPSTIGRGARRRERVPERNLERTANPMLCVERVSISPSPFAHALTRVSECPAVMQRSAR